MRKNNIRRRSINFEEEYFENPKNNENEKNGPLLRINLDDENNSEEKSSSDIIT